MNNNTKRPSLFFSTNAQKILAFFLERPNGQYYDAQVSEMTGISRAGTNVALRYLNSHGYLHLEKRGRMRFYKLEKNNCTVRQYKVLLTIENLRTVLEKIMAYSERAVLFGSKAKGTDNEESDIDILIVTRNSNEVTNIIAKSKFAEMMRPICKSPAELIIFRNENLELARSIDEGILLWEETSN